MREDDVSSCNSLIYFSANDLNAKISASATRPSAAENSAAFIVCVFELKI